MDGVQADHGSHPHHLHGPQECQDGHNLHFHDHKRNFSGLHWAPLETCVFPVHPLLSPA